MPTAPSVESLNRIERNLGRLGYYDGPLTLEFSSDVVEGLQNHLTDTGCYSGSVDGTFSTAVAVAVQRYVNMHFVYSGAFDGNLTESIWLAYVAASQAVNQLIAEAVLPPDANTVLPAITGTLTTGNTLTVSNGTWTTTPDSYAYQWYRSGSAISGATANTYVLTATDVGTQVTARVTASKANDADTSATSAAVTPNVSSFSNSAAPAITGTARVGFQLSVSNGTWTKTPDSYTYQWNRAGVAISGATSSTYTAVLADQGSVITCTVTAVKAGYTNSTSTSAATSAVAAA